MACRSCGPFGAHKPVLKRPTLLGMVARVLVAFTAVACLSLAACVGPASFVPLGFYPDGSAAVLFYGQQDTSQQTAVNV